MVEIIIVVAVVVIFIVSTILNSKTKVPDNIELPDKCQGCNLACDKKEQILTEEVIKQIKEDIHCKEEHHEGQ